MCVPGGPRWTGLWACGICGAEVRVSQSVQNPAVGNLAASTAASHALEFGLQHLKLRDLRLDRLEVLRGDPVNLAAIALRLIRQFAERPDLGRLKAQPPPTPNDVQPSQVRGRIAAVIASGPLRPQERLATAASAAREMARPAAFGQVIILLVLAPLLTFEGVEGKMFIPMAATVMLALAGGTYGATARPATLQSRSQNQMGQAPMAGQTGSSGMMRDPRMQTQMTQMMQDCPCCKRMAGMGNPQPQRR